MQESVGLKAEFKAATVKGGKVLMQFEALAADKGCFDAMKMAGQVVGLGITCQQEQMDLSEPEDVPGQMPIDYECEGVLATYEA